VALEVKLEKAKTFNDNNPVYRVVLETAAVSGRATEPCDHPEIEFSSNADRLGEQMRQQFQQTQLLPDRE
jgi:hypothetical protein